MCLSGCVYVISLEGYFFLSKTGVCEERVEVGDRFGGGSDDVEEGCSRERENVSVGLEKSHPATEPSVRTSLSLCAVDITITITIQLQYNTIQSIFCRLVFITLLLELCIPPALILSFTDYLALHLGQ